jgi:hypothetical protein
MTRGDYTHGVPLVNRAAGEKNVSRDYGKAGESRQKGIIVTRSLSNPCPKTKIN